MATRKREGASEQHERLRKVTKLTSPPLNCPVCEITLRPDSIASHYEQELQRIQAPPPPLRNRKRKGSNQSKCRGDKRKVSSNDDSPSVEERAQMILDSVRRKHFQFEHPNQPSNQPGPSHQTSTSTCPVCDVRLPVDQEAASSHVASCLAEAEESGDSENGYEEYTWGDETRVRATSLLSHRERANIFNWTVMSQSGEPSQEELVDVESDNTATFGPTQFNEAHIQDCTHSDTEKVVPDNNEATPSTNPMNTEPLTTPQCLICMGSYTEPLVSVLCWHVYCEKCWLQALKAQKLCPKCKRITCAGDLRRIFL